MRIINSWKSFNEAMSYPDSIKFLVDIVSDKCQKVVDNYIKSNKSNRSEVITISYEEIEPYIKDQPKLFELFPVETMEVSLNLIGSSDFKFQGISKSITSDGRYDTSYMIKSKSGIVDEAIYYKIALAVGIDKSDANEIENSRKILDDIINHEIQHGYDEYNRMSKNIDIKGDYVFYNTIVLLIDDLSKHIDFEENPMLPLFFMFIYNCSEVEIKSAVVEPGREIKSIEDWNRILGKRYMDYDFDNLLEELKEDRDYELYEAIPQIISEKYLLVCRENNIKPIQKYINICKKDFESFVKYWIKVIRYKSNKIKRKSAKRIIHK